MVKKMETNCFRKIDIPVILLAKEVIKKQHCFQMLSINFYCYHLHFIIRGKFSQIDIVNKNLLQQKFKMLLIQK